MTAATDDKRVPLFSLLPHKAFERVDDADEPRAIELRVNLGVHRSHKSKAYKRNVERSHRDSDQQQPI